MKSQGHYDISVQTTRLQIVMNEKKQEIRNEM